MTAPAATLAQPATDTSTSAFVARMEAEILALRDSARTMNEDYAHSGLTNPRADRMITRADGMEYALSAFRECCQSA